MGSRKPFSNPGYVVYTIYDYSHEVANKVIVCKEVSAQLVRIVMAGVNTSCMRRLFCSVHLKKLPILTVPGNKRLQRFASNSTDLSSHVHYEDISVPLLKIYGNSQRQVEVNRFLEVICLLIKLN